ncbi:FAD-dependent oxidoreductase [Thermodesulfobacteriota bacterium]
MKLFEPGRIGRLSLKNRIIMAPMAIGALSEPDGSLSQWGIDYYVDRAKGGVGLIIAGASRVTREIEYSPNLPFPLLIVNDGAYLASLSVLAKAVHGSGAKIAVQLGSGQGRNAALPIIKAIGAVAPSPLPAFSDPSVKTRELTIEEIERLVQAYGFAAKIASTAGMDGIEINAHSGYLIDQFMTALWNKRTDKYGGDFEGRLRFPLEILEAAKKEAGADFPVIFRFGLTHYFDGGRTIEEGLAIVRRLEAAGVDALHIDAGSYETMEWAIPTMYQPQGCMVDLAGMVKKAVNSPVIAVGKLGYPEVAERALEAGNADFVALGRALLADPEWPRKVMEKRLEDIRPCIGDRKCLEMPGEERCFNCTVNPATGMKTDSTIRPAERKKSVLVVGGGPGGMEAARVAAHRGHKVALWEKGNALGGNLIPASIPDFKEDYRRLISYLSTQTKNLGVAIELGKEATPELIKNAGPEVVFIATGGSPLIPDIPGVKKKNVITAVDLLLGKAETGKSVVVVGGGLVGGETALYLAQRGKQVTVVEVLSRILRDTPTANRVHLTKLLANAGVKILTDTKALEITDEGIIVSDKSDHRSTLDADTVVLAIGLKPNDNFLEALKGKVPEIYAIGDCAEPRQVFDAIWEGFRTARLI